MSTLHPTNTLSSAQTCWRIKSRSSNWLGLLAKGDFDQRFFAIEGHNENVVFFGEEEIFVSHGLIWFWVVK